jgi:hypothetical protein
VSAYTSATIESVLGVPPATLRKWVERGHVTKLGRDLYDGDSVIERWRAVEALQDNETVTASA